MKKLMTLMMALVLMMTALAGCSSSSSDKVQLKILDTEYITEEYAIALSKENTDLLGKMDKALTELKADGTLQTIVDKYISGKAHDLVFQQNAEGKEELVMATDAAFPPYEYYEGEVIVGIDAEIAAAIADKLDMKLVIEDMEFGSILAAIETGKVDCGMAGMTVTEEREAQVNFTQSYATSMQVVIVPEGSPITSVDVLFEEGHNWKVAVQQNTTSDIYATDDIEAAGLGTLERYAKPTDAVQALITGKVDCMITDNEPAKAYVAANNK